MKTIKLLILILLISFGVNCVYCVQDNAELFRSSILDINNKRKNIRIPFENMKKSPTVTSNDKINRVIDISRGGVGFESKSAISEGEIIPVNIKYGDKSLDVNAKIVFVSDKRIGAQFIPEDKTAANLLLYISIMLEADNGMLVTDLKG